MIIDGHTHLFKRFGYLKGSTPEEFVAMLQAGGADRALVFTLEGFFGEVQRANDYLAEAAQAYPDVLYPFGTVNPWQGKQAVDEIRRCAEELGMLGLKFHSWLQAFPVSDDALMAPVVEEAIRYGLPLVFHDGTPPYCTSLQVARLAARYPEATIILGHSGLKDFARQALYAAQRHPNIWLCFCSTPWWTLQRAVETIGPDRVFFGSDLPFCGAAWLPFTIAQVKRLPIDEEARSKILGGNLQRLLGIG